MHRSNYPKFVVLLLFVTAINFTITSQTASNTKFLLKGTVTHNKLPLRDVNISIKETKTGTKTDAFGNYSLKVAKDDVLQFSHLGFITISINIKNNKDYIKIEMIPETNVLEEALLRKVKRKFQNLKESDKPFMTSRGIINPRSAGYRISYVAGNEISSYTSLTRALLGRVPSYSMKTNSDGDVYGLIRNYRVLWDVDGFVTDIEPPLILANVKDIYVLGSSTATITYGLRCNGACGGVIVVRMKKGNEKESTLEEKMRFDKILDNIKNSHQTEKYNSLYSETFRNIDDLKEAFEFCKKVLNRRKSSYYEDLQLMKTFVKQYSNVELFKNLSTIFIEKHEKNSDALTALAFELQALELREESINTYKTIFNQGKKNAKSYRDLANAFIENNDFKRALKLYLNYIQISSNFSEKDIDKLIYRELEWLYYWHNNSFSSNYKFIPSSKSKKAFSADVRIVLEWNNPKVSFNINFYNKKEGSISYEHSNDKSIEEEFSIEEFLIAKLGKEDWSIDLTYFGNDKKPTYFKATCYYNWGKENQHYKIKTFRLEDDYEKTQLFKLTSKSIIPE